MPPTDPRDARIAALEAELAEAKRRLSTIEQLARQPGGILIHAQFHPVKWGGLGLGVGHRTLVQAVDQYSESPADVARAREGAGS